jgi:molybdopterin/thiamine biosynthesis adenylyltransferase
MPPQLINRSPDLKRLRDEGYDIEVRSGHVLVKDVPYWTAKNELKRGTLVSELTLAGDVTTTPRTHVAMFIGEYPCYKDGSPITQIFHQSARQQLGENLAVDHSFSSKPATTGAYKDYYEKMTTYAAIISGQTGQTAKTFPVIVPDASEDSIFSYIDTASSRAGINMVSKKLEIAKVGIIGLGGTGSYVLDLVAKTPVREIHLFDGDDFLQHNAFRCPGAPSVEDLRRHLNKAEFFGELYSRMRRGIVVHDQYIDASNAGELNGLTFAFLCLDRGGAKKLIIQKLEELGIPFVDVGMGLQEVEGSLMGILRTTTSTPQHRSHVWEKSRIPFPDSEANNEYSTNIQIADLNALNAALAVVKWKKLCGFYADLENEHHSTYMIDGNLLTNED